MENYIVSARKYRPRGFEAVVGQESITRTLKNAILNKQLAHAYLFCGPHGIGKTTCARIFARTINCQNLNKNGEACGKCESCIAFNEGRSFSIHELDAASNNSVEDIRSINDQVRIPPQVGKYSLYIIDEVHMLSAGAFNAFLKTLEEPPEHAIFILATTEKHKIIPTILSRCQIYDFHRIHTEEIMKYLEYVAKNENIEAEQEALNIIASKAEGSMRDALSIFDQIVNFSSGKITYNIVLNNLNVLDYDYYFKITDAFLVGDCHLPLLILKDILDKGFDALNFISGLSEHFRDLLVCKDKEAIVLLEKGAAIKLKYLKQSDLCSVSFLFKALEINNSCSLSFKAAKNKRLHVELNLVKLSDLSSLSKTKEVNEASTDKKKIPDSKEQSQGIKPTLSEKKEDNQSLANVKVSEPEAKRIISKSTSRIPKTISIKDTISGNHNNGKIGESDESLNTNPLIIDDKLNELKKEFSQEDVIEKWKLFAEGIKNDEPRLYSTLTAHLPELKDGFLIEVVLNNPLQEKAIKAKWNDLLIFLKQKLENGSIKLNTLIAKKENTERLYTDEEKFGFLNKKNPNLGDLRTKLNLDFE